jgi:hypothetical protein
VECSCEHGIEPSGSIKCWGVLEWLQTLVLLLLRASRRFYGFNSYCMGETRHSILVSKS